MPKMKKFSPLSQDRIHEVIGAIHPEYYYVARNVQALKDRPENQHYRDLIARFNATSDAQKKQFIEENSELIIKFLNESNLLGYKGEEGEMGSKNFVLGAEGIEIISTYLRIKEKNQGKLKHEIQTIKNTTLITDNGLRKHSNIFLEKKQVHLNLQQQLQNDLKKVGDGEFSKSYLVEVFGTTGGNHFVTVTVHKNKGENPVVHLLDPSPDLLRNGAESTANWIANGWCSQFIIQATCKKAFSEIGLELEERNFFANSETLQAGGFSICGTFAYEMAYEIAKLSREEHIALLRAKYKYPSFFGGFTEMNLSLDQILQEGYVTNPQLELEAKDVFMSHFSDAAFDSNYSGTRREDSKRLIHPQKNGASESQFARRERYEDIDGVNRLAEEKSFRHRFHLFEIVSDPEFLKKAEFANDEPQLPAIEGSPYIPKNYTLHPRTEQFIKVFDSLFSKYRINFVEFNEESKKCKVTCYLGFIGADKLKKFMEENGIDKITIDKKTFDENLLPGVDPRLSQMTKVEIIIPEEKFADLIPIMKEKGSLFPLEQHLFMPPDKSPKAIEAKRAQEEQAAKRHHANHS